jgi:hypothetical protein
VLGVRQFAEQLLCPQLGESCAQFIQQHFVEVSRSEEFLNDLSADQLAAIIGQDELNVQSEEQVCGYFKIDLNLVC